jgi:hypothetical protein
LDIGQLTASGFVEQKGNKPGMDKYYTCRIAMIARPEIEFLPWPLPNNARGTV